MNVQLENYFLVLHDDIMYDNVKKNPNLNCKVTFV